MIQLRELVLIELADHKHEEVVAILVGYHIVQKRHDIYASVEGGWVSLMD